MTEKPPASRTVRRRHARLTMELVALLCVVVAVAPAAYELSTHGWQSFVTRPPGVGATQNDRSSPTAGEVAQVPVFTRPPDADDPSRSTPAPVPVAPPAVTVTTTPAVVVTVHPVARFVPVRRPATVYRSSFVGRCSHRTAYR